MLCRRQFCQAHANIRFSIIPAATVGCFYVPLKLGHTGIERSTWKDKQNTAVLLQLYLSEEDVGGMPQQKFSSAEKI